MQVSVIELELRHDLEEWVYVGYGIMASLTLSVHILAMCVAMHIYPMVACNQAAGPIAAMNDVVHEEFDWLINFSW